MPDMFQIGLSGLTTTQARLNTTSHNIANVNTEGYSRQVSNQNTRVPERAGVSFQGTGVVLAGVERAFDDFKYRELLVNTTRQSYNDVFFSHSQRLDQVLSDEDTAISNSLFAFFQGVNGVADSPNSLEARNVMIENAKNMTASFNRMYNELVFQQNAINDEINNIGNEITALSQNLAETNVNILTASAGDVVPPNDLYDQRDEIIRKIAELTNVSTVIGADGQANLYIGSGTALVVGGEANVIKAIPGNPDTGQLDLAVELPNVDLRMDSRGLGGKMQALFEYRNDVLNPAFSRLGYTAVAISDQVNRTQREGLDLDGQIGTDFFRDINETKIMKERVLSNQDGLGTATMTMRLDDVSKVKPVEYTLTVQNYTAGPPTESATFELKDLTNGTVRTVTFPDLAASRRAEVPEEGFSLAIDSISGVDPLQTGKTFRLRPTHLGANEIKMEQDLPNKIAAAASDVTIGATTNAGNIDVEMVSIDDRTDPLFPKENQNYELVFTNIAGGVYEYEIRDKTTGNIVTIPNDGNSYNLTDNTGTAVTYGPGTPATGDENTLGGAPDSLGYAPDIKSREQTISVLGFTFKIKGTPAVGDTISIGNDETGVGDNRNAVKMADLQDTKLMNDGKSTFQDNYSLLITEVGSVAAAAEIRYDAGRVLLTQAGERLDSVRGVNIDEEATDLLKYQQTYSANARVLSIAKELFDTVISSLG